MDLIQGCSEQASTCWAPNITSVLMSYSHISSVKQYHEGTGRADCAMAPGDRYYVDIEAVVVVVGAFAFVTSDNHTFAYS
jgi:hypothetical protein